MISVLATSKRRKLAQVGTLYRSSRKSKLPKTKEHRRVRGQRRKRNLSMKSHKLLKHAVSSILFTRPGQKWNNLRTSPKTKGHRRMRCQRRKRNLSMKNYKLLKHAVSSILFTRHELEHKRKNLPTSPVFLLPADLNQRKSLTRSLV